MRRPFDAFEIGRCCDVDAHDGTTFVERCDDLNCEHVNTYFTLYGHTMGEGVEDIADRQTGEQCADLLSRILDVDVVFPEDATYMSYAHRWSGRP